jgi:hypothetical protein
VVQHSTVLHLLGLPLVVQHGTVLHLQLAKLVARRYFIAPNLAATILIKLPF